MLILAAVPHRTRIEVGPQYSQLGVLSAGKNAEICFQSEPVVLHFCFNRNKNLANTRIGSVTVDKAQVIAERS